ncbi:type II toxin-antitoxin system RelE/ParE family toxin [Devosia sp.]|uniref:type II toxin-antitoxin system RelE/ParE family toxin n=1 Tax=Devosia sp. TaxID=1871048 RepID=UPI00345BC1C2
MRLSFSPDARKDLLSITRFISADNPARAISFSEELTRACMELADQPERYATLPRYGKRGVRRRPYGSYSIIYDVGAGVVHIVRIISSARNLDELLD